MYECYDAKKKWNENEVGWTPIFCKNPGHIEKNLEKSKIFKVLVHFDEFLKFNFPGQQRKSKYSSVTAYENPGQSQKNPSKCSVKIKSIIYPKVLEFAFVFNIPCNTSLASYASGRAHDVESPVM